MVNNIVEKVFCITTINSDRTDYIQTHLNEQNIEFSFVVAPDYKIVDKEIKVKDSGDKCRPSISLLSTYVSIMEASKLNGYKSVMIVEDDCFFAEWWKVKFKLFYDNLPEWDLLNMGYHPSHDIYAIREKVNDYVFKPKDHYHTTHCMIVNNSCYAEFVKQTSYSLPVDYVFNEIYKNSKFKSFAPVEKFIYQLSRRNDYDNYEVPGTDIRFDSFVL